ncbi:anti-sigma factor family protein [Georgenia sp. AZ-5]|uniref:anti-sigma factor family protein n=1 Tax=Georgenia sp. AZ-5 TaxID=3367526 RepID=UPI0037544A5E
MLSRSECHRVARLLQGYLDGELDPASTGLVAEHLEYCRRCGLEARTYEAIKVAIGATAGGHNGVDPAALDRLRAFADDLSEPPA